MAVTDRFKKAWNAFRFVEKKQSEVPYSYNLGTQVYSSRDASRVRYPYSGERTIINSIYTRLAVDIAEVEFKHVKVDDNGRYVEDVDSSLNDALQFEANIDQSADQLRHDIAATLFSSGVAAVVPVDTSVNPTTGQVYDIYTLRVGTITQWYPEHVRVNLYNEKTGNREEITLEKSMVAIVENPFYAVMNEPNSTLQRLIRKLNMLDVVDEASSSGKLDLIIQLPYMIKSEARREQAEKRRNDIEFQLSGSPYGIAYTDGTERITQLNRPAENNLLTQIQYLTEMLYEQLGITESVMNGTADEATMLNYQNRTIVPIVRAISKAFQRSFVGLDRYKKNERVHFYNDPFKLVPLAQIAEIADKFTRNEIATSNEIRSIIGFTPFDDPKADMLLNSNMPQQMGDVPAEGATEGEGSKTESVGSSESSSSSMEAFMAEMEEAMTEILDGIEKDIDNYSGDEEDEEDEDEE